MNLKNDWVSLSYNVPINPSKNRVYVWRKLKESGAEPLNQGVAILPNTNRNVEYFKKLSQKIDEMGGTSTIILLSFIDEKDTLKMIDRFKLQTEDEYNSLINECKNMVKHIKKDKEISDNINSDLKKLAKKYNKAKNNELLSNEMLAELEEDFTEIKESLRDSASDIYKQFKALFENF